LYFNDSQEGNLVQVEATFDTFYYNLWEVSCFAAIIVTTGVHTYTLLTSE